MTLNSSQQRTLEDKVTKLRNEGLYEKADRLLAQYSTSPRFEVGDYADLPEKVIFNQKAGVTILIFPAGERYIAKCSADDLPKFDAEFGFLVAYAQRATELGKGEFNKRFKSLLDRNTDVSRPVLIGFFLSRNTGFSYERYIQYMHRVLQKSTVIK